MRWSSASKQVLLWVTVVITVILVLAVIFIPGFLAVSNPEGEGILVVEGWIPSKTLAESALIFNSGRYRYLVVVGGPIHGSGDKAVDQRTYAELAASRLEKLGLNTEKLVKISVPTASFGHRTLAQATAVKNWIDRSGITTCCVDVFTVGVHARRSWILFRYGLGDNYRVGIIAGSGSSYRPRLWLASGRNIWAVVRNLAGYLYWKLWILLHGPLVVGVGFSVRHYLGGGVFPSQIPHFNSGPRNCSPIPNWSPSTR